MSPKVTAQIDRMKPAIAAIMLSTRTLENTAPMDGVLYGRAVNQDKRIVFLEQGRVQAQLLVKWMNLRALKATLDDLEDSDRLSRQMHEAYLAGDAIRFIELEKIAKAEALQNGYTEAEYRAQMEDLLYKRNASWIAPIEKLHADGGGFIAVGAMHLVGPRSVLELLASKGYKITRVTP